MSDPKYQDVLEVVSGWPVEDRIALARDVLGTIHKASQVLAPGRPSFERALGLAKVDGNPPTDEQVAQWVDEHRSSKYGK